MTIERIAFLSIHTSPLATPGTGDAGGMNVYVDELSRAMAARGLAVDVFTRREHRSDPDIVDVIDGYRVRHIDAGPPDPTDDLAGTVGDFAEAIVKIVANEGLRYDLFHSHYWLSGWAGVLLQDVLEVPLAISFHTLGRVKAMRRRDDEPPPTLLRLAAEGEVIARAGCVVASTPTEAADLIEHYGADPERLCVNPPGVDHDLFQPGDQAEARRRLGIDDIGPVVVHAGRIQPLKGLDVTVGTFEIVAESHPTAQLVVVGGPSGPQGADEMEWAQNRLESGGLSRRVTFLRARRHDEMPDVYRAADVVVVPSRSESFGLVAAEAQACGVPVVAADAGGLRHAVADGRSGFLVAGWDPKDFADSILRIVDDPNSAQRLAQGAMEHAERFSWTATVDRLLELYSGIVV